MPLDKLSGQAQHLDGNGRASLVHLVRDGGMSHRCADTLCRLTLLMHNWASTLLAHFEDAALCYIDFQDRSAELSAMHWVRSIVVFSCWPYPLLASHLMTEAQRRNLWDLFLVATMCCLDEDFGYPLQLWVLSRPGGSTYLGEHGFPRLHRLVCECLERDEHADGVFVGPVQEGSMDNV